MKYGSSVSEVGAGRRAWTFLTNHAHVLLCIAQDPGVRLRDVAVQVGITERAAQAIVADLVSEGYVTRSRVGRRNQYEVHPDLPMRHPAQSSHEVGELLALLEPRSLRSRSQQGRRVRFGKNNAAVPSAAATAGRSTAAVEC